MGVRPTSSNPEGLHEKGRKYLRAFRNYINNQSLFYDNSVVPAGQISGFEDGYELGEDPSLYLENGNKINFDFRFSAKNKNRTIKFYGEAKYRDSSNSTDLEHQFLKFLTNCMAASQRMEATFEENFRYLFVTNTYFELRGISLDQVNDLSAVKSYLFDASADERRNDLRLHGIQEKVDELRSLCTRLDITFESASETISRHVLVFIFTKQLVEAFYGDGVL